MDKEHLSLEELDFDDPVDSSHLDECEDCRKRLEVFRFLGFQVRSAPRMEAPPFFAQRVTRLAQEAKMPFSLLLGRAARQMVPVFTALILATGLWLYQLPNGESAAYYSELLFEQSLQHDVSLESVLNALAETTEGGGPFEEPE